MQEGGGGVEAWKVFAMLEWSSLRPDLGDYRYKSCWLTERAAVTIVISRFDAGCLSIYLNFKDSLVRRILVNIEMMIVAMG